MKFNTATFALHEGGRNRQRNALCYAHAAHLLVEAVICHTMDVLHHIAGCDWAVTPARHQLNLYPGSPAVSVPSSTEDHADVAHYEAGLHRVWAPSSAARHTSQQERQGFRRHSRPSQTGQPGEDTVLGNAGSMLLQIVHVASNALSHLTS